MFQYIGVARGPVGVRRTTFLLAPYKSYGAVQFGGPLFIPVRHPCKSLGSVGIALTSDIIYTSSQNYLLKVDKSNKCIKTIRIGHPTWGIDINRYEHIGMSIFQNSIVDNQSNKCIKTILCIKDILVYSWYRHWNRYEHIIMTDFIHNEIKIFSNTGEQIHSVITCYHKIGCCIRIVLIHYSIYQLLANSFDLRCKWCH